MDNDVRNALATVAAVMVIVVATVAAVMVIVVAAAIFTIDGIGRYQCGGYAEMTGKPTKWRFVDSCYVEADAGWQRWDEYKARATASELGERAAK